MTSCWFCREEIEEPREARAIAISRAATSSSSPVDAPPLPPSVGSAPAPIARHPRAREHVPIGRVLLEGIVAAFLITLGLLGLEAGVPKYTSTTPASDELERRTFKSLSFAVAVPSGWEVSESKRGVRASSGEIIGGKPTRGFRVRADELVAGSNAKRFDEYAPIDSRKDKVDGKHARVYVFTGDGLRYEQWWVERAKKRPVRVELWSRAADDDAIAVNERIARSLDLL